MLIQRNDGHCSLSKFCFSYILTCALPALSFYVIVHAASRSPEINFGVLPLGEIKRVTFTLSNLASSSVLKFQWCPVSCLSFIPTTGHIKPNSSRDITISFSSIKPISLKAQKVIGKMCRINYLGSLSEVSDWDDSMKSIHWVNVLPPGSSPTNPMSLEETSYSSTSASALATSTTAETTKPPITAISGPARLSTPAKKKVEEIEKEPSHAVIDDTSRDLEMLATGLTDNTKYECAIKSIKFKDTLMYQTRLYRFSLKNTGLTYLEFTWIFLREDGTPPPAMPTSLQLDKSGNVIGEGGKVVPFTVEPSSGVIPPETEGQVTVRFSPLDILNETYLLRCQ